MKNPVRKVVLAYFGGLDTSIIIPWLKENYGCEIVALAANIGQDEDLRRIEDRAVRAGAEKVYVEDLRYAFATTYLWPLVKSGARYEGEYLLGTSIAGPLLAKRLVEIASLEDADAVVCGWTAKANDRVRFEHTFKTLAPHLRVIDPWRELDIQSRYDAIEYARSRNIPFTDSVEKVFGRDSNLWHMSHEGGVLDDPSHAPPSDLYFMTLDPRCCPEGDSEITIDFEQGVPVGLNGCRIPPVQLIEDLNEIAGTNGIGRVDLVESSVDGTKSRGIYETPGGTLITVAQRELESLCLDRQTRHQKDVLSIAYAQLVYEGRWYTPLREALDAFFAKTQETVTGSVTLGLHRGVTTVKSRVSANSLYRQDNASFGVGIYRSKDVAERFINLPDLPAMTRPQASAKVAHETLAGTI